MLTQFKTLADLMVAFRDAQVAIDYFTAIRWPEGAVCPYCACPKAYTLRRKNRFRCSDCTRNFSVTVGTIFEDTKLPLRIWFGAIWLIINQPKGITSPTLARKLGINQKSAYLLLQRLRHADLPVPNEAEDDDPDLLDNDHTTLRRTMTQQQARFSPDVYADRYESNLVALDLVAALRKSIGAAQTERPASNQQRKSA